MLSRIFGKSKSPPYLALAEYWVYVEEPVAPKQDDVMTRMVQSNPYAKSGIPPIGPKEGLLWSDIRFHMALVLREKNAQTFRPDLFEAHVEPSAEDLTSLSKAKALIKLRYVSEQVLPDNRHLQFLTYAVESVAELTGSNLIFDLISERLLTRETLQSHLTANPDGSRKAMHLRTLWRSCPAGGTAETRGLRKIGLPELCTPETMNDHQCVATQILELAADRVWEERTITPKMTLEQYGDTFHILVDFPRRGPCRARILRETH